MQTLTTSSKVACFIGNTERVTNHSMEALGFNMWANAVEKSGTTSVDEVSEAMYGLTYPNLTGGVAVMNTNHHLTKPVLISEIQDDGQFVTVWQTPGGVIGDVV